jgi:hypothetical protein
MRRTWLLALLLLAGCAYYNGMYNANRLAKRARKSERAGRTFEAQGYWAQAEVRADSVVAQHPRSTWVDDAQLIRGEAMISRGDCPGAIPALEDASLSRDSPDVAERALALLGRCRLVAGDLIGADRAFVALMSSPDSARRGAARLQHASVLRTDGSYQAALDALDGLEGPAPDAERAAAYAGLGRIAEALPLIDQALARQDLALPWDSTLAGIGRADPGLASRYASAVVLLPGLSGELRDDLLMADGLRLLVADPDSGLARLRAAASVQPITNASLVARLRISEYLMAHAATLTELESAREGLSSLSEVGGPSSIRALGYLRVLDRVRAYTDSVPAGAPQGDLATFVVAETVREGVPAPQIAAQLFASVPASWPASPYAPKALLALAVLQPAEADSIFHELELGYPDSPYLRLVAGDVTPAVLALEDSLQAYGGGVVRDRAPAGRRAPAAAGGAPAGQRPQDELK